MQVHGTDGLELGELWRHGGAATYLGTAVHGFPNLFLLAGPQTGLGHNSIVFMIEAQLHLVVSALRTLASAGPGASVDVRASAQAREYGDVQRKMTDTVWLSGCNSWYRSADGRVDTLWPGPTYRFWFRTRRFHEGDFDVRLPRRHDGRRNGDL